MYDGRPNYSISKTIAPGKFEVVQEECAIIVHYQIIVEVFDEQYTEVAKRSRDKQIKITFTGMEPNSDLNEVVDSLIGQTPLLPESKRDELYAALYELQCACSQYYIPTKKESAPNSPMKQQEKSVTTIAKSGGAKHLAVTMSQKEVNNMLHESVANIGMGSNEDVLLTLNSLVEISEYDRNLALMIKFPPLMNAFCQITKTLMKTSLPGCACIMKIFYKMSTFKNFHEELGQYKVGLLTMGLVASYTQIVNMISNQTNKQQINNIINGQNTVLRYAIPVLFNLSYNPKTMRKMVEKGIIPILSMLMTRKDPDILTTVLRFIRKISSYSAHWGEIDADEIINSISDNLFKLCKPGGDKTNMMMAPVYKEALDLLFQFSHHPEIIEELNDKKIFDNMENLCAISSIRGSLLNLFYQVSIQDGSMSLFKKDYIFNMLILSALDNCNERLVALVVLMKLTADKEIAAKISNSPVFTKENVKSMFIQSTRSKDDEGSMLLKLIRNVADTNPSLVEGFDDAIIEAADKNRRQYDNLTNIMAVANRSEIDSPRSKFFISQSSFISIIISSLKDPRAPPQLHLEIIMFVSSLVLFSTPAKELAKNDIVNLVIAVFNRNRDEADIQAQCLFAFYRFIIHGETRKAFTAHPEIIDRVIELSGSNNQVVSDIAGHVLEALLIFDKEWTEKIKLPRFLAFNRDWVNIMHLK